MKITSKGQVTIPLPIREALGLHAHSEVEFVLEGNSARLRKARRSSRGDALVARMRGTASPGLTTDEIMKLTRG